MAHLALDGNRWNGGDCLSIYYNITRGDAFDEGPDAAHQFADVYIYRTRRHGIHLTGGRMRANQLTRLRVYNVGDEGVTEAHGYFINCPDSFLSQCESGSSAEHIQIIGTVMDNVTAGVGGSGAGNASNLILVNG